MEQKKTTTLTEKAKGNNASANAASKKSTASTIKTEREATAPSRTQTEAAAAAKKAESAKLKAQRAKQKAHKAESVAAQAQKQKQQAAREADRKKLQAEKAKNNDRAARRAEKKALKEEIRKEKFAERQARKAKAAQKKAERKAEKTAKKAALKKERALLRKRKAALKKEKAQARAEKAALKRDKVALKQERAQARAKKAELKAEKKRLRAEKKQQAHAEKEAHRRKNATERQHRDQRERRKVRDPHEGRYLKTRGLTAAVIVLGVTTLALASALTVYRTTSEGQIRNLEGFYARAFTDLIGAVDEMDSDLSKLSVTTSSDMERNLAMRLIIGAERAENSLSELPLPEGSRYGVAALINRIGAYAKYLEKTADSKPLTEKQREMVASLAEKVHDLQKTLYEAQKQTGSKKFRFSMLGKEDGPLAAGFESFTDTESELPKLIFDGPFSKATDRPDHFPHLGKEIDRVAAEQALKSAFSAYELKDITFQGEGAKGPVAAYSFTAKDGKGNDFYAQISKMGGKVILFDSECKEGEIHFSDEVCVEKAAEFLKELGIADVTAVWTDSYHNECTVNFAAEQNGVILYPDLIKVKVCKTEGHVLGMEAFSYHLNHRERTLPSPKLSESEASALLSSNLAVTSCRLCLAPLGFGKEELCYEFCGTANGQTYYVYLSALTGKDVQIFRVVEGTEGTLLS